MRDCAVIGCDNKGDPRWSAHGHDGQPVMICDGHDGTICQATTIEDCTCPPIRITAEPYHSPLARTTCARPREK